ncbi:MAG: hypothetical protein ACP6IS_11590 [Candidatus Asgardarchaeia archaeon]
MRKAEKTIKIRTETYEKLNEFAGMLQLKLKSLVFLLVKRFNIF